MLVKLVKDNKVVGLAFNDKNYFFNENADPSKELNVIYGKIYDDFKEEFLAYTKLINEGKEVVRVKHIKMSQEKPKETYDKDQYYKSYFDPINDKILNESLNSFIKNLDNFISFDNFNKVLDDYIDSRRSIERLYSYVTYKKTFEVVDERREENLKNLFVSLFYRWRNNLILALNDDKKYQIYGSDLNGLNGLVRYLNNLPDNMRYEEVVKVFENNPDKKVQELINKYSYLFYDSDNDNKYGLMFNGWTYIKGKTLIDYNENDCKFYLNCKDSKLLSAFILEFTKVCDEKDLPYEFKFSLKRNDSIVIYCSANNVLLYKNILEDIVNKYPKFKDNFNNLSSISSKIGYMGFGSDLKDNSDSYNSYMSKIIENVLDKKSLEWFLINHNRVVNSKYGKVNLTLHFLMYLARCLIVDKMAYQDEKLAKKMNSKEFFDDVYHNLSIQFRTKIESYIKENLKNGKIVSFNDNYNFIVDGISFSVSKSLLSAHMCAYSIGVVKDNDKSFVNNIKKDILNTLEKSEYFSKNISIEDEAYLKMESIDSYNELKKRMLSEKKIILDKNNNKSLKDKFCLSLANNIIEYLKRKNINLSNFAKNKIVDFANEKFEEILTRDFLRNPHNRAYTFYLDNKVLNYNCDTFNKILNKVINECCEMMDLKDINKNVRG